jgi:carbonic anhydrase
VFLPEKWNEYDSKCNGKSQSPIDINSDSTVYFNRLAPIERSVSGKMDEEESWKLANIGSTAKLTPLNRNFDIVIPTDNQTYRLLQMHFHWRGSEHLMNSRKFAGELHLVHQCLDDKNKFAVLGFFFDVNLTHFFLFIFKLIFVKLISIQVVSL